MKIITILAMLLMGLSAHSAKNQMGKYRMDLGVAHPNYLGESNPTGVLNNDGFGMTVSHRMTDTTPSSSESRLYGHFGQKNFGFLASYGISDPDNGDEMDFAGAFKFSIVSIGFNDDEDVGLLFDITDSFRLGLQNSSGSNQTAVGVAYDLKAVSLALDYTIDSDTGSEDWKRIGAGLGFHGASFFGGFKFEQTDTGTAKTDKKSITLGYDASDWILGVTFIPNTAANTSTLWFTYNF